MWKSLLLKKNWIPNCPSVLEVKGNPRITRHQTSKKRPDIKPSFQWQKKADTNTTSVKCAKPWRLDKALLIDLIQTLGFKAEKESEDTHQSSYYPNANQHPNTTLLLQIQTRKHTRWNCDVRGKEVKEMKQNMRHLVQHKTNTSNLPRNQS